MRFERNSPSRCFRTGLDGRSELRDWGCIMPPPDEQVAFVTREGRRHDFTAESRGFYATPSRNARPRQQGFQTARVRRGRGRLYIMVVATNRMDEFYEYLRQDRQQLIERLDERGAEATRNNSPAPA